MKPFIEFLNTRDNSVYVLPYNGLKIEIFSYSLSTYLTTQPDSSLIQSSILYRTFWKDLSSTYLDLITVLVVELK